MVMRLFGDAAYVPTFMLGLAAQHGKLPVGSDPIEEAIRLNDVAVDKNLLAFSLGRLAMCDPERFSALAPTEQQPPRSEEHTSELQSLMRISYAVFCLKIKKQNNT